MSWSDNKELSLGVESYHHRLKLSPKKKGGDKEEKGSILFCLNKNKNEEREREREREGGGGRWIETGFIYLTNFSSFVFPSRFIQKANIFLHLFYINYFTFFC